MKIPETRGISSASLEKLINRLCDAKVPMHSLLVARGEDIVFDAYWAPFTRETLHRMNSVTKSFVALAVGCLIDDGKVNLEDKIIDYFPETAEMNVDSEQAKLRVVDLLSMRTGYLPTDNGHWVRDRKYERIKTFFSRAPRTPINKDFYYDSTGSYILAVMVERLTGTTFLKFLQERILDKIGFSKDADCIMGAEGYTWADSGLLCTAEDLYKTARFIASGGVHNGERLMSEKFLRDATSAIVPTPKTGKVEYKSFGYGYQIWKTVRDGFMFNGMGAQIMLYIPDIDLYLVCTADTQPNEEWREIIFKSFYEFIDSVKCDTLPEDAGSYEKLCALAKSLKLVSLDTKDALNSIEKFKGKIYKTEDNPMGIKWFSVELSDTCGQFIYENAQGKKAISFGFGYNEFSQFPEDGYFDMTIGESPEGHRYPIAVSASANDCTLELWVQFIGRHLGGDFITVAFDGDMAHLKMKKTTNCFLDKYHGEAVGRQ